MLFFVVGPELQFPWQLPWGVELLLDTLERFYSVEIYRRQAIWYGVKLAPYITIDLQLTIAT